jgi:hypothetical protein
VFAEEELLTSSAVSRGKMREAFREAEAMRMQARARARAACDVRVGCVCDTRACAC